jgi:hypothetical protein
MSWSKLTHGGGRTVPNPDRLRKLTPASIMRVHGWIEAWRNAAKETREEMGGVPAHAVIASVMGVHTRTAQDWLAEGEIERALDVQRCPILAELADLADEIRRLQTRPIGGTLYKIACDETHPKVVNAAALLLPRLDRAEWGPQAQALDVSVTGPEPQIHQIPQAVFDALSDEARAELLECQERIARDSARVAALLAG